MLSSILAQIGMMVSYLMDGMIYDIYNNHLLKADAALIAA
jgi:hypothetical protein